MKELYDTNERFRTYVNAYCFKADIQVEEALQHNIVREVGASYYKGNKKKGVTVMNVRKFLSDVRVLNNTIQKKQQRLDMLKAGLYPSLNMSADKIQNSFSEDQMADTIVEIADLSREINSDIDRYYNLTKKCIELIDLHSSARSREILVDIYINRYSLSQIGKTFHRTARQISRIRDKAINEIQHIVNK